VFPAQRIEVLKRALREQKTVDIATLSNLLQVSDVTVRKYLDKLESEGFLVKFHGGAMLAEDPDQAGDAADGSLVSEDENEGVQIARLAKTMIDDGDSVFIGPGSTCFYIAREIAEYKNLTVVTNNVRVLELLAPHIKNLQFIGGEVAYNDGFLYTYGQKTNAHLEGMYVQKAFLSVHGVDMMAGLTTNDYELLDIYKKIDKIAKRVVILADHKKFNKVCLHQIAKIEYYDVYISNEKLDSVYKKYFFENNIKILTSYDL